MAGAWQGLKEGYFDAAVEQGQSFTGLGKGVYGAAKGTVTGIVGLGVAATRLQIGAVQGAAQFALTGDPSKLHEVASEATSIGSAVKSEIATTVKVAAEAYKNPGLALDAATELGIEGTAEVVGGATFETAAIVAGPKAAGATARVVKEGVRGARTTLAGGAKGVVQSGGARFGGRVSRSGGEILEGASWHRVKPGFDQPWKLSPVSEAARTVLRGRFEKLGRSTNLPYRQRLTLGVRAQRTFATATRRHPPVEAAPVGGLVKRLPGLNKIKWEQGHVFLQQRWWRHKGPTQWFPDNPAANLGMRRAGNAGFNLAPMPRAMNRWLGRHPWASFGVGVGAAASIPGAFYGGYRLGEYAYDQISGR